MGSLTISHRRYPCRGVELPGRPQRHFIKRLRPPGSCRRKWESGSPPFPCEILKLLHNPHFNFAIVRVSPDVPAVGRALAQQAPRPVETRDGVKSCGDESEAQLRAQFHQRAIPNDVSGRNPNDPAGRGAFLARERRDGGVAGQPLIQSPSPSNQLHSVCWKNKLSSPFFSFKKAAELLKRTALHVLVF
jgi:hypothetical protein